MKLLRSKQVREALGNPSYSTLCRWRRLEDMEFPDPALIINGQNFWREEDIFSWIEQRVAETGRVHGSL